MDKDQDGARAKRAQDSLQEAIGKITGNVAAQDGGARNKDRGVGNRSRDGIEARGQAGKASDTAGKQRRN